MEMAVFMTVSITRRGIFFVTSIRFASSRGILYRDVLAVFRNAIPKVEG